MVGRNKDMKFLLQAGIKPVMCPNCHLYISNFGIKTHLKYCPSLLEQ